MEGEKGGEGTPLAHTAQHHSVSRPLGLLTMALPTCRESWLGSHKHRLMECGFFGPAGENQLEMPGKKSSLMMRSDLWNVSKGRGLRKKKK